MNNNHGKCTRALMIVSVISLILATVVSLFQIDLWLAGTQWILVSIALAVYAVACNTGCCSCCGDSCGSKKSENSDADSK